MNGPDAPRKLQVGRLEWHLPGSDMLTADRGAASAATVVEAGTGRHDAE